MQKLLFLFCKMQEEAAYEFIPYKFGCFSFLSYADKRALIHYNILANETRWKKIDDVSYLNQLKEHDKVILANLHNRFAGFTQEELIGFVYKNYPYYAEKSLIRERFTKPNGLQQITQDSTKTLFTIGYEGITIDEYLNKLIKNRIALLCDVRKNPISMKYGFSKKQLAGLLQSINIKYIHIPELGIESSKRKALKQPSDYEQLFSEYRQMTLPNRKEELAIVFNLIEQNKRIALTCFESEQNCCHRREIVRFLSTNPKKDFGIQHL